MKSYFPDINVWIALSYEAHLHHLPAKQWFDGLPGNAAYFCRFTQLGFLKLLTHPSVMGDAVKSQHQAWRAYDLLNHDPRVLFLAESDTAALDPLLRKLTAGDRPHTKQWPDAYLAAFARAAELILVTFDRSLGRLVTPYVLLLG